MEWCAGKSLVPCELQEVLAPGNAVTDTTLSRMSLWGVHVPLGDALLISAQASRHIWRFKAVCHSSSMLGWCAMLCAYHHARAHCPAHMLMRKQVNSHREGEQTVEWSVSCQDSRFLIGEAHCAFESMAAVAAAQLAGALLSC